RSPRARPRGHDTARCRFRPACPHSPLLYPAGMHVGEAGVEIALLLGAPEGDDKLVGRVDALLRRTCLIARALTGAEQAALKLWVDEDSAKARKYFSLSEKYGGYGEFRVNPQGFGLHGMAIPPGEVMRLTQEEVVNHPLWRNFGPLEADHPPMRGWLA